MWASSKLLPTSCPPYCSYTKPILPLNFWLLIITIGVRKYRTKELLNSQATIARGSSPDRYNIQKTGGRRNVHVRHLQAYTVRGIAAHLHEA